MPRLFNTRAKKIVAGCVAGLIVLFGIGMLLTSGHIGGLLPHHPVALGLPMDVEYDSVTDLIPLGETINHPNTPGGHPGIDFLWTEDTPIIAMADGTVKSTQAAEDSHGKYDVTVVSGLYEIHYDELDELAPGLRAGSKLKKGDFIGYPQRRGHGLHLEFILTGRNTKLLKKELCPLSYFDDASLARINTIWENASAGDKPDMKKRFPKICNGYYDNLKEPSWLLLD
jgi:hypothetical protein